jgi:hypothetical protein
MSLVDQTTLDSSHQEVSARVSLRALFLPAVASSSLIIGFRWGFSAGLSAFVIGLMVCFLAKNLTNRTVWTHWRVFVRHLKWTDFLTVPALIVAVLATASMLYAFANALPVFGFLKWGWWSMLGGQGNIVMGKTTAGPSWMAFAPLLVLPLLFFNIPRLAFNEEEEYRRGSEHMGWGKRAMVAFRFGMVHLVMGIPILGGMALTVAGFGFLGAYLRALKRSGGDVAYATHRAGAFHAAYNLVLVTLVAVSVSLALAG